MNFFSEPSGPVHHFLARNGYCGLDVAKGLFPEIRLRKRSAPWPVYAKTSTAVCDSRRLVDQRIGHLRTL